MLKIEKECYIVYPSWLEPRSYTWENMGNVLADPLRYNQDLAANSPPEQLRELGFPETIPAFSLISGPAGGGIIEVNAPSLSRWLPAHALGYPEGICLTEPNIMGRSDWKHNVSYLENDTYLDKLELGRRRKNYELTITPEHIEALDDKIYWLFCLKKYKRKKEITFIADVINMANHYKLNLVELTTIPDLITDDFKKNMPDDEEYLWFEAESCQYDFGYHFAVLMYISLCLCPIAGPQLISTHLLAEIEGEPHFCF